MIQIDRQWLINGEPSANLVYEVLLQFEKQQHRLNHLKATYHGAHDILQRCRNRGAPNHRLSHDIPGYIVALTSGYLVGEPVQYTTSKDWEDGMDIVRKVLSLNLSSTVDSELATDAAVCGRGVEVYYADEMGMPRFCQADATSAFVVYDDTVEHRPAFGVLLSDKCDEHFQKVSQRITIYTDQMRIEWERLGSQCPYEISREPHFFGQVPMTEFWNNERTRGDFEGVLNLINAYDALQSDRVNDKQQFTDALMVIYGATVEEDEDGKTLQQRLRETRTLEMPASDAKVEYLTKTLSESDTEVLKDSIKSDIHKLSFVPDLSDREFGGNVSGVAMEYKLFGLEQLTKIKERWFREGLISRLRCLLYFLRISGYDVPDVQQIQPCFSRSLPVDQLAVAQTIRTYEGLVPTEILLSQIPFVEDAKALLEKLPQTE